MSHLELAVACSLVSIRLLKVSSLLFRSEQFCFLPSWNSAVTWNCQTRIPLLYKRSTLCSCAWRAILSVSSVSFPPARGNRNRAKPSAVCESLALFDAWAQTITSIPTWAGENPAGFQGWVGATPRPLNSFTQGRKKAFKCLCKTSCCFQGFMLPEAVWNNPLATTWLEQKHQHSLTLPLGLGKTLSSSWAENKRCLGVFSWYGVCLKEESCKCHHPRSVRINSCGFQRWDVNPYGGFCI